MTYFNRSNLAKLIVVNIALAAIDAVSAQTGIGSVTGKLVTESGQPLPGATVVCRRGQKRVVDTHFHSQPAPGELAVAASATTMPDGTFSIGNLPVGNYSLCLDSPPPLYVDHCEWGLGGAVFAVDPGATTALKPVTIISGVRIHLLISDPQAVLPATGQLEPVAHIGVRTPAGTYRPGAVNSRAGGVTEVVVTVPHNQPISAWVFSRTLKFTDSTGATVGTPVITLPQGATDYNVSFTVSK